MRAALRFVEQQRRRRQDRHVREPARELGSVELAPEAVSAEQDDVAGADRHAAGHVDRRIGETTEAAEDLVAIRMLRRLLRLDRALVEQILDLRVVLGLRDHLRAAKQIQPRIADVRPVRAILLQDARDARCAWRLDQAELLRIMAERLVRAHHRVMQEQERIAQHRLRFILEALDQNAHHDLRGDLATGVAAHSIGGDHDQAVAAVRMRDAILVHLA